MADKVTRRVARPTREGEGLRRLLTERGLGRYGVFFETGEGRFLPDGTEEGSGYAIDEGGRVFYWRTAWDAEHGSVTFETWEQVERDPAWAQDAEYREARADAGLSG